MVKLSDEFRFFPQNSVHEKTWISPSHLLNPFSIHKNLKGTSTKKQQIGKLIHGQSLDVVDHKSIPKRPTLTSCKSIDLQVPQVTSERRHSLVGLNILLPEKKRFNLKRSKSTCDLDDQESIDKDKQKSDNNTESKSDTENNENGKKLSITIIYK